MAKGGSGDLLTGLIAGMLAQFPGEAARAVEAAVYLHGLAADLAVRAGDEHTLLATHILKYLSAHFACGFRTFAIMVGTDMFGCRGCRRMHRWAQPREGLAMTDAVDMVYEFTTENGAETIDVGASWRSY